MFNQFESLGLYLPEKVVKTEDVMASCVNKPKLNLQRITGIETRRRHAEGEDSYTIALAASKDCLKNSKYKAEDLDIIINTAITRFVGGLKFQIDPPISVFIKKELGATKARIFDITNACAGMMTGVYILDNMIKSGAVKNGMVVSGECITPIADNAVLEIGHGIDPQMASLTVGDAGTAVIMDLATEEGIGLDAIELMTFAKHSELCWGMPSDKNPGVAMYTDAVGIHSAAISKLPSYLEIVIERFKKIWNDYDVVIPHQTAKSAINLGTKMIVEHFDKDPDKLPTVLCCVDKFGNTASTAVFVALYDALQKGQVKKGDQAVMMALASGLVLGLVSFVIGDLKVKEGVNN